MFRSGGMAVHMCCFLSRPSVNVTESSCAFERDVSHVTREDVSHVTRKGSSGVDQ